MTHQLKGDYFFEPDLPIYLNRETESFELSQHTHDFVELSLVAEGRGYQYIDDQTLQVSKGDLFLLPIGTSHVFRPSSASASEQLVIYNCIFRIELLEELSFWHEVPGTLAARLLQAEQKGMEESAPQRWYRFHDRNGNLLQLFASAYYEYSKRDIHCGPMLIALLTQILVLVERLHKEQGERAANSTSTSTIEDAIHYIHQHYHEKLTLKTMAELTYMSESHFQNQFKRLTNQSFTHYVQNVRIEKSCELLQTTTMPIQHVAAEVGYSDMKFYHALFRKLTGVTPHAYRKAHI
jgi:AraC family transcriptional regulator, L-rhamnose operon transcriptional activator RhaR